MKKLKALIKGILITAVFILAFGLSFNNNTYHSEIEAGSNTIISEAESSYSFFPSAYAADPKDKIKKPKEATSLPEAMVQTIVKASSLINKLFNPIIYFLTKQIGGLLSNDYIYGDSLGKMLQSIWVVSRNIVNIVFVLILLFLALRHIFSGDENSDLKKALPTFVLMLIAINFSWLGTKLVLDAANVATNVAFAIPSGVKGVQSSVLKVEPCVHDDDKGVKGNCMPKQVWYPFDSRSHVNLLQTECAELNLGQEYNKAYPPGKKETNKEATWSEVSTICWETLSIDKFSRSSAAYYLTYGMAKVQNLPQAQGNKDIAKVGIGTLVAVLIQVVYIVAFGSLFVALVIRAAALWILVAFSPFMVLLYYLSKNLSVQSGEVDKYLSFKALADWAFMPTKIAAVWAIGFIMITTGQTATDQLFVQADAKSAITSKVFSVNSLFMNMDNLQEFIWLIMTIGIIWVGTFAVLKNLSVGSQIFQSIDTYGTSLAKEIATSPKWAPIIPMLDPATGSLSMKSYAQSGFDPLKDIRGMKEKYTNMPVNKLRDLEIKFKNNQALRDQIEKAGSDAEKFKLFQKHTGFTTQFIKDSRNRTSIEQMMTGGKFKNPKELLDKIIIGAGVPGTAPTPSSNKVAIDSNQVKDGVVKGLRQLNIDGKKLTDAQVQAGEKAALDAHKADPKKDLAHYMEIAKKAATNHKEEKKEDPKKNDGGKGKTPA